MRIAIQSADLDAKRIDGTRVYILRLLERFGTLLPHETWHLFHRNTFNPNLTPPSLPNYFFHRIPFPFLWTQTRFAWELSRLRPERVFMPLQALPIFLPKGTESIVTIHDLAFKLFPEHFPTKDVRKLNWLTDFAVRNATRLIAVSESTKRDILKYYPDTPPENIRVIHHGFDEHSSTKAFPTSTHLSFRTAPLLERFHLIPQEYLLYVGALQPRKNLLCLMKAFEAFGRMHTSAKLVLAGEAAWMSEHIFRAYEDHPLRDRIVLTGSISFEERALLYQHARIFVYPSLYEGFGLPILEAFSAGVPVICANNSSLPEVAGDAAIFFDATRSDELTEKLLSLWENTSQRSVLIQKGRERCKTFSWDTCARETAEWIVS